MMRADYPRPGEGGAWTVFLFAFCLANCSAETQWLRKWAAVQSPPSDGILDIEFSSASPMKLAMLISAVQRLDANESGGLTMEFCMMWDTTPRNVLQWPNSSRVRPCEFNARGACVTSSLARPLHPPS